jgi:hypothetical protein
MGGDRRTHIGAYEGGELKAKIEIFFLGGEGSYLERCFFILGFGHVTPPPNTTQLVQ